MTDSISTVATYPGTFEAELAKHRLEAEGIRAFLADEETAGAWNLGGAMAAVKLQVGEQDWARASEILVSPDSAEDEGENHPVGQAQSWTCPVCGLQVGSEFPSCPACEAERKAEQDASAGAVGELRQEPSKLDAEETEEQENAGDKIAERAFQSAIFACGFFPLHIYSLYLLVRLGFYDG